MDVTELIKQSLENLAQKEAEVKSLKETIKKAVSEAVFPLLRDTALFTIKYDRPNIRIVAKSTEAWKKIHTIFKAMSEVTGETVESVEVVDNGQSWTLTAYDHPNLTKDLILHTWDNNHLEAAEKSKLPLHLSDYMKTREEQMKASDEKRFQYGVRLQTYPYRQD